MYFNLTSDMFRILISLHGSPAWPKFIEEFKKIRDDHVSESLHFVPTPRTVHQQEINRGIAICLDVLCHAFEEPYKLLEEIEIVEKEAASNQSQNHF